MPYLPRLAAIMIVVMLINAPINASDNMPICEFHLEKIMEFADLVVEGRISKVECKLMDGNMLLEVGRPDQSIEWVVTEVAIEIDRIFAGECAAQSINVILREGEYMGRKSDVAGFAQLNPKVGDSVIIALIHNLYGWGDYTLLKRHAFFRIEKGYLAPYMKEAYMDVDDPLKIIEREARARSFEEMYKNADLVCIGQVAYSNETERKQEVKVARSLKGELEDQKIALDGKNLLKHFYQLEPGYNVLLFLEKKDSVYKTLAGINGYFKIESGKLIRNQSTVLNTELSELEAEIDKWRKTF